MTSLRAPLSGVLAALSGMAAAHLTAALLDPAASPVLVIGSTVIDLTPTPVKEWAVSTFGTADKPILLSSVLVVVLALSAVAGALARRRPVLGIGLLVSLAAVASVAALVRPTADPLDVLPSVVAAVVGGGVLAWLTRTAARGGGDGPSRRGFLLAASAVTVTAAALAVGGEWLTRIRSRIGDVRLPSAAKPQPALPAGLEDEVPGISPFRTPNDRFYRVDTRVALPLVSPEDWTLTVDGDVEREVTLSFDELLDMPMVERDITLTCVSNEVGGSYVGAARWLGVPLKHVLDLAGIGRTGADQILSTDVDGMTISTPLEAALDGRDTLVAVGMNGEPLPRAHGFPARLVTPGLYGFVGSTKWLSRLTLTTYGEQTAYWTDRDWATDAPIKVSSRIDTPKPLATLDAGKTFIGGVAWAQQQGIAKVEVRVDGGAWQQAELGPDAGIAYWRQWYLPWEATSGRHDLAARATTEDGDVQTAARATPFPSGSTGIQQIAVNVR